MAGKQRYKVEQVIDAIERGMTPYGAARMLGCHPDTVRNYTDRYPTVKRALLSKRKELVDLAELGLRGALLDNAPWAIAFTLRTLGRDYGYVERTEQRISGEDGGPIKVVPFDYNNAIAAITTRPGDDSQKEVKNE
jgi:hypothetical protein